MATSGAPDLSGLPLESRAAAIVEARWLFDFAGRSGESLEALRELIAVPPEVEGVFRKFAAVHPDESIWIDHALRFRAAVLAEFEKLTAAIPPTFPAKSVPANLCDLAEEALPEMRESEAALSFREEIAAASRFHHTTLIG